MSLSVDIRKNFPGFSLDVSFEAPDATKTLALLGASGCGKSMALKCIAGIETPDEGRIVLNDRVLFDSAAHVNVPASERRVGYLFQNYALFPTMTVAKNVETGVRSRNKNEVRECAAAQIRAFRLEGLEDRKPSELSGGQQQRCALARIMANEPELLLLDEPFSALDGFLRWQIELELADTLKAFPGGVVFVTHSRDEAYRMCDQVCVLTAGKSGRTVGTHELFDAPATRSEAIISGCKNVSEAVPAGERVVRCVDWGVELACAQDVAGATSVGVRAHFLRIVRADGRVVDTIGDAETGFGSAAHDAEKGARVAGAVAGAAGDDTPGSASVSPDNRIECRVARVIDNVFSTIVMCDTPGTAQLRVELSKDAWASLEDPTSVTIEVSPADVMVLRG